MKKLTAIICTILLCMSLVSCGSASSTIVGRVTAIDGEQVTLALGTLEEREKPEETQNTNSEQTDSSSMPAPPNNNGQTPQTNADGSAPTPPTNSDGTMPTPPTNENGTAPTMPTDSEGQPAPPSDSDFNGKGMGGFTESGETKTLSLSGVTITIDNRGEQNEGTIENISVGSILTVEMKGNTVKSVTVSRGMGGGMSNPGGGSNQVEQGNTATSINVNTAEADTTYTSSGNDENALRIDGATVTLENITVNKNGGSSSNVESGDFYGMNAALLATGSANVTIKGATVSSSAQNGNGIFSYGQGTTVTVSDTAITTTADNSGGIQTTGGATTNATNLTINTAGNSSAAIRSDRGGGTVNVDGGTYNTTGYNSPAVYSTAAISVKNATLNATNSEALVIEGKNSITLENCNISGNMSDDKGSSSKINVHNVMIYQSMSGDAAVGTSSLSIKGGSLTSENGDLFYATNTACTLSLEGVAITNKEKNGYFLLVSGNDGSNGWGKAGSNGAQMTFNAKNQTIDGNIAVDSISTLNMTLSGNSTFNGTINITDNANGNTSEKNNAVVTIESGSTWNLTGNCTVSSIVDNGTINCNGYTITLADGTVLK